MFWSELLDFIVSSQVAIFSFVAVIGFLINKKAHTCLCVFLVYVSCSLTDEARFNSEYVGYIYFSFTVLMCGIAVLLMVTREFVTSQVTQRLTVENRYLAWFCSRLFKTEKYDAQDFAIIVLFITAMCLSIYRYIDYWYIRTWTSYTDAMILVDMLLLGTTVQPFLKKQTITELFGCIKNGKTYLINAFSSAN